MCTRARRQTAGQGHRHQVYAQQLRRSRAAQLLGVTEALVDAALAYYAEHTDEIDADLATRARLADEAEALWRRQQALLQR
jgi:hypothetical protein